MIEKSLNVRLPPEVKFFAGPQDQDPVSLLLELSYKRGAYEPAMAGNVLPDVFYDEAELIRRQYDPATRQLDVQRFRFDLGKALAGDYRADFELQNGDEVVVRSLRSAKVTVRVSGEVRCFPDCFRRNVSTGEIFASRFHQ